MRGADSIFRHISPSGKKKVRHMWDIRQCTQRLSAKTRFGCADPGKESASNSAQLLYNRITRASCQIIRGKVGTGPT
jgi:hypothetical protein